MNRSVSNMLQLAAIIAVFAIGPVIDDRAGASQALANANVRTAVSPAPATPSSTTKVFPALQPSDVSTIEKMQAAIKQLNQQVLELQSQLKQLRDGTTQDVNNLKKENSSLAGNINTLSSDFGALNTQLTALNQQFAAHHHTLHLFQTNGVILPKGQSNGSITAFTTGDVLLGDASGKSHDADFTTSGPQ